MFTFNRGNMRRYIIGCGIMVFMLAGCARDRTPITEFDLQMSEHSMGARIACYQARERATVADIQALAKLPPETLEKVMMLKQQNDVMREVVAMVTGNSADPCGSIGDNYYTLESELTKADAAVTSAWVDKGFGLLTSGVMYGAIGYSVHEIVDGMGSTYAAYDSSRINTGSNADSQNADDSAVTTSEDEESSSGISDEEQECMDNPPAGMHEDGWPQYSPGCSCNSHYSRKAC